MKECRFYERDEAAFEEHMDYIRHCAAENPSPYMDFLDEDRDELPCYAFCKHYGEAPGFPGEILYLCKHPDNKQILGCESVFDGV
jgi:hypothetical protein